MIAGNPMARLCVMSGHYSEVGRRHLTDRMQRTPRWHLRSMPSVSGAGSLIRPVSLHISDTLSSQCPASPCPGDGLGREPGALSDS